MSWNRFTQQVILDCLIWLYVIILLQLARLLSIAMLAEYIHPGTPFEAVFTVMRSGFIYDNKIASLIVLLSLVFLSVPQTIMDFQRLAAYIRMILVSSFSFLTILLTLVHIEYYKEYNDVFNDFIFGILYDDQSAIAQTIWNDYHPIPKLILVVLLSYMAHRLVRWVWRERLTFSTTYRRTPTPFTTYVFRAVGVLLFAIILAISLRGSVGSRPAQAKDSYVTTDPFLNRSVLPSYIVLQSAMQAHNKTLDANAWASVSDRPIQQQVADFFAFDGANTDSVKNIDDLMQKTVQHDVEHPARHLFVLIMESFDNWPLQEKFSGLKIAEGIKKLASEGIYIRNFIPSSHSTMRSMAALVSGIPDAGVYINYQPMSQQTYPSSIAYLFNQLGYKTRMFYGGYLSWQRTGSFMRNQGFDEVYGLPSIACDHHTEWGVDDECLFRFIEETVTDDEPSLTVVMSSSNHPPYLLGEDKIPASVNQHIRDYLKTIDNAVVNPRALSHYWYADKEMFSFVKRMEKKLPYSVFAITGDHFSREYLTHTPSMMESISVPLVLYGRDVLKNHRLPENASGSHLDIAPTLFGLAAPKGTTYHTMGNDLLHPHRPYLGFGRFALVYDGTFISAEADSAETYAGETIAMDAEMKQMQDYNKTAQAIGWWRVMKSANVLEE